MTRREREDLQPLDHVLVILFLVVYPAWAGYRFRQVRLGQKARIRAYLESAGGQWAVVGVVVLYTLIAGGELADLGLTVDFGWKMFAVLVVAIAAIAFLFHQAFALIRDEGAQEAVRKQIRRISPIMPRSLPQLGIFVLLAITAGICEEILFRGFLIAYLDRFFDIYSALLLSSVMFGLAHAYQGIRGILQGMVAGLIFGALYLFTGSLLAPVLLHVAVDIHGGWAGYYATSRLRVTQVT